MLDKNIHCTLISLLNTTGVTNLMIEEFEFMFMLVLWNQILGQFHKNGKDPQKLPVTVQNCMHIYQISYKKPQTILVKLNNTPKKNCQRLIPPDGATARGGPWPPLQYASRPFGSLLCLSIRLHPSFSGPWTRHPAISFLVFLFVSLRTAFRTSFLGFRCLAFFLYGQAIVFFGI